MSTLDRPQGYTVGTQTGDPESLGLFLRRELFRISQIINELAARSPQRLTEAPANPRVGQVVYASAPWNPGSGDGIYIRTPTGWQHSPSPALPLPLPAYTVAGLPSALAHKQSLIYVSNGSSNRRLAISDGTSWRFPDGNVVS